MYLPDIIINYYAITRIGLTVPMGSVKTAKENCSSRNTDRVEWRANNDEL